MIDNVPVRDAATVVLLRDGVRAPSGDAVIETWLLSRVTDMVFAAGMSVFPGGRVEATDGELPIAADVAAACAQRFGCDEPTARALLGAAVRETFEETGVLLTTTPADLRERRADVEGGRVDFGELLRENELTIDAGALRPWARWVTPRGNPRRYDTRFFIAVAPEGAEPDELSTESTSASWIVVGDALEQAQRGERRLMPPTAHTISTLVVFADVAAALAAADDRVIEQAEPQISLASDGSVVVRMPDGSSFSLPRQAIG